MDPATIMMAINILGSANSAAGGLRSKKEARDAERAAAAATQEAIKNIEINRYAAMQVPLEPLELQTRGIVSGQQQLLTALQEAGARGVIGGVGRIGAVGVNAMEDQRQATDKLVMARDKAVMDRQSQIDNATASIYLSSAEGAQIASQEKDEAARSQFESALTSAGEAYKSYVDSEDLFPDAEKKAERKANRDQKRSEKRAYKDQKNIIEGTPDLAAFDNSPFNIYGLSSLEQEQRMLDLNLAALMSGDIDLA
jgi:hypothetical protein